MVYAPETSASRQAAIGSIPDPVGALPFASLFVLMDLAPAHSDLFCSQFLISNFLFSLSILPPPATQSPM
jgi:hypothetical protein